LLVVFSTTIYYTIYIFSYFRVLPSSFFFFIHPSPPEIYTLSYTTLFRSTVPVFGFGIRPRGPKTFPSLRTSAIAAGVATAMAEVDRKSTRLNSSHSQISYAVFCLKKKKKNRTMYHDHMTIVEFSKKLYAI